MRFMLLRFNCFIRQFKDFFVKRYPLSVRGNNLRRSSGWFYAALITAFLACCALTAFVFSSYNWDSTDADASAIIWVLNIDLIIVLIVAVTVARRVVSVWSGRKRNLTGSHLHVRLVYMFSLLAAVPAIIMTVSSAFLFHYGIQSWFSERVQGAINNSSEVAEAYLAEHKQGIAADVQLLSWDLRQWQRNNVEFNKDSFETFLRRSAFLKNLPEVIVFDVDGNIYGRSGLTFSLENQAIPSYAFKSASEGETVVLTDLSEDRVRALVRVNDEDQYLYVGRLIDPQVLDYLNKTKAASSDYQNLKQSFSNLQVSVILVFVAVALVLILVAVWLALILSRQIVAPIKNLVEATDQIRAGDFSSRLPEVGGLEEFDYLAKAFNRMTDRIKGSHTEILMANKQLDERRRLNEAVLKGVSSCVLAINKDEEIYLANEAAKKFLCIGDESIVGMSLKEVLPNALDGLSDAYGKPSKIHQSEIIYKSQDFGQRRLNQRIAIEAMGDQDIGAVITLDDITDLQKAEKKAAWGDVARRIAHEIKNPLTPIQLSAERIRRKYGKFITDDKDIFDQCIKTITKNVEDIGYMVNEFSSFARMPAPQKHGGQDISLLIDDALFSQKQAFPDIDFKYTPHLPVPLLDLDPKQIRQVLQNIILNAAQSITVSKDKKGLCHIVSDIDDQHGFWIAISDNGPGFPAAEQDSLLDPYVTFKKGGTGLGLAIVKKILDDHDANITLGIPQWLHDYDGNLDAGGATLVICFPHYQE